MPADPYVAEVTKFKQGREATLKGNTGWLTIAGLWFLTQPQTTFGSDPLNDIVSFPKIPSRLKLLHLPDSVDSLPTMNCVLASIISTP